VKKKKPLKERREQSVIPGPVTRPVSPLLNGKYVALAFILFSFLLYGNTLFHDYALDDAIVIKDNAFTKKGLAGIGEIFSYDSFTGFFGKQKTLVAGGRYRPLSLATFSIEYQFFGGLNPFMSHLVNILLYALTGWLIFIVLKKALKRPATEEWYFAVPFLTAILFMAHPVHTEVVANIKGRDELLALIFSLSATGFAFRFLVQRRILFLLLSGMMFFLGLLSKENTVMFLFIIPLASWYFIDGKRKGLLLVTLPLLVGTLLFILIRYAVLGYFNSPEMPKELLNDPFLGATLSQKYGTILYTLGLYLKLLFFPHPLTHDYYPFHIALTGILDWRALISLAIYAALLLYAFSSIRTRNLPSFGILFYLITLFIVSNIIFPVGTFMNERFIYMPSLGFVMILAWFFGDRMRTFFADIAVYKKVAGMILLFILAFSTIGTISRNPAWNNDFTLATTDVLVSGNSSKCTTFAGGKYLERAQETTDTSEKQLYFAQSMQYLEKAVTIYPENKNALLLLGNAYALSRQDYKRAIGYYMKVFVIDPSDGNAFGNALRILGSMNDPAEADFVLQTCMSLYPINPESGDLNYLIGKFYGQFKGNLDSSETYLLRAVSLSPSNPAPYKDLGVLYGIRQQFDKALGMFTRASELDPNDAFVQQNIVLTNQFIKQSRK
jgi:tetratricopeptide (TPR) repeat protein